MLTDATMSHPDACFFGGVSWSVFVLVGAKFHAYNGLQIYCFFGSKPTGRIQRNTAFFNCRYVFVWASRLI